MLVVARYSVRYKCRNCGWSGKISFNKGEEAYAKKTCPNCDCYAAEKAIDPAPMIPMPRPALQPDPDEPNPRITWPPPFPEKDSWEPHHPWRRRVFYCRTAEEKED